MKHLSKGVTYTKKCLCRNCGERYELTVLKGTTVEDHLKIHKEDTPRCKNCGCYPMRKE